MQFGQIFGEANRICSIFLHSDGNIQIYLHKSLQIIFSGGKNKCKFGDIYLGRGERLETSNPKIECACVVPPDVFCFTSFLTGPS